MVIGVRAERIIEGSEVGSILTVCWRAIGYSDAVTQKRVNQSGLELWSRTGLR
jgi:hypothetical protein